MTSLPRKLKLLIHDTGPTHKMRISYTAMLSHLLSYVLPVRAPGHLQLDLLAVFDVTFEGLIDQQSVTEDSTRPSFF